MEIETARPVGLRGQSKVVRDTVSKTRWMVPEKEQHPRLSSGLQAEEHASPPPHSAFINRTRLTGFQTAQLRQMFTSAADLMGAKEHTEQPECVPVIPDVKESTAMV